MLEALIEELAAGRSLTGPQAVSALEQLTEPAVPDTLKAEFLSRLAQKGETIEEIAAFAGALRAKSIASNIPPRLRSEPILDVVGTGGDRLCTFNISTATAIVCAAAGVRVAKHGNRSATSACGSADVLEALGIPTRLRPEDAVRFFEARGFVFFFAPDYHPAFKHVAQARKLCAERGQRTIFNFLGPLLNPARPSAMLVGVPRPDLCETLAKVLQKLDTQRALVVCGEVPGDPPGKDSPSSGGCRFLDEVSTLGDTTVAEFYQDRGFCMSRLSPAEFAVQPATLADLQGGRPDANARIIRELLAGTDLGPKRDAVLLNTAAALLAADRVRNLADGWALAAEVIDRGSAKAKLEELTRP